MEKYGTIFDSKFNLHKYKIRNLLCTYFDNPKLIKVKNTSTSSIYMAMIYSQLLKNKQFIVTTCDLDKNPISTIKLLSDIPWSSFQTRMLDKDLGNMFFSYEPKKTPEYMTVLTIRTRNKKISEYECNVYNIIVSLLHDNDNIYEYPNSGTLAEALETFKTIITFRD